MKMKTESEIRDYLKMMEEKVTGIVFIDKLPDPYDKGWYDALRWVTGVFP